MQEVKLLDGSMGEELIERGFATRGGLWSAAALVNHPAEVKQLHLDYIEAGARYIGSNTYSTIPSYLDKQGLGDRCEGLTRLAGQLATEAAMGRDVRVMGSLPPLDESYRPDLVPPFEEAEPIYRSLVDCLDEYADLFLAETMSSIEEAVNVARVVRDHSGAKSKDLMISFTLEDMERGYLRSGESVEQAINTVERFEPAAILFNCSTPEAILSGLRQAKSVTDLPLGCYPNRFRPVPEEWTLDNEQVIVKDEGLTVDSYISWMTTFIEEGACFVGGCCGIGPAYIRGLSQHLSNTREQVS